MKNTFKLIGAALIVAAVIMFAACGEPEAEEGEVTFTITFDSDGGTAVSTITVVKDQVADKPTDPTKEITAAGLYMADAKFTFNGWRDEDASLMWDWDDPVTGDLTLKAQWTAPTPITLPAGNILEKTVDYMNDTTTAPTSAAPRKRLLVLGANVKTTEALTLNTSYTELTIVGTGSPRLISPEGKQTLFTVGATAGTDIGLIIGKNITLSGAESARTSGTGTSGNNSPLVAVTVGGTFTMEDGSLITDNKSYATGSSNGAAVFVNGTGQTSAGTFTMKGGEITGNEGAAVNTGQNTFGVGGLWVSGYGIVNLEGGSIEDNTGTCTADIFFAQTARPVLKGNVVIGELTLRGERNNSLNTFAHPTITLDGFTGTIDTLNLASYIEGQTLTTASIGGHWSSAVAKEIIKAQTGSLDAAVIAKFNGALGEFFGTANNDKPNSRAKIANYEIGTDGKLKAES